MTAWPVLSLTIGVVAAGTMGFAIQRGATCMVAAMEEVVERRRFNRLVAILEASLIVAFGLALAKSTGLLAHEPSGWQASWWSVAGGVLLGLGAFVTRACVFGAIARLGSGEWAYLAVPPGYFAGCLLAGLLLAGMHPSASAAISPVLALASIVLVPLGAFALWRAAAVVRATRRGMLADHLWSPHVATSMIGLAFVVLLLARGPWSYTEALADAARGMTSMTGPRVLLFLALFGGALTGGWTAGRLMPRRPTVAAVGRCLAGGALMGVGSTLVPGSNDGLLLVGLPLLQPHAYLALGSMAASIALAMSIRRLGSPMADRPRMA